MHNAQCTIILASLVNIIDICFECAIMSWFLRFVFDGYCDNMASFPLFLFSLGCFCNGIIICSSSVPKK